jgi:hypothetical protein
MADDHPHLFVTHLHDSDTGICFRILMASRVVLIVYQIEEKGGNNFNNRKLLRYCFSYDGILDLLLCTYCVDCLHKLIWRSPFKLSWLSLCSYSLWTQVVSLERVSTHSVVSSLEFERKSVRDFEEEGKVKVSRTLQFKSCLRVSFEMENMRQKDSLTVILRVSRSHPLVVSLSYFIDSRLLIGSTLFPTGLE